MGSATDTLIVLITSTLRMAVPVMLASVGASFSMRSGVISLGCEGMMLTGALFGVYGAYLTDSKWIGVCVAIVAGIIISSLHAYLHVTHKVNASLSGMSVNLLGTALGALMVKLIWKSNSFSAMVDGFTRINPEWISNIPVIGKILAGQNIFFYVAIVLVILSWGFMYKTPFGLRLRMVGENPVAANTVGINTVAYKYFGVLMSGAFCGLGGAYLSLANMNMFVINMTAGRGYVAMVINNLGRSNPLGAAFSSLFFGFFDSMQIIFQNHNTPSQVYMMMPYIFTIIAAVLSSRNSTGIAGVGKHFDD